MLEVGREHDWNKDREKNAEEWRRHINYQKVSKGNKKHGKAVSVLRGAPGYRESDKDSSPEGAASAGELKKGTTIMIRRQGWEEQSTRANLPQGLPGCAGKQKAVGKGEVSSLRQEVLLPEREGSFSGRGKTPHGTDFKSCETEQRGGKKILIRKDNTQESEVTKMQPGTISRKQQHLIRKRWRVPGSAFLGRNRLFGSSGKSNWGQSCSEKQRIG